MAHVVGNAGGTLNANGKMHSMPVGGGGGGGIYGNIFQGLGGIYPLPVAAGHGLGGAAALNATYAA